MNRSRKKRVKVENYLKVVGSFSLSAQGVYKRVCRKIAVIFSFYLFVFLSDKWLAHGNFTVPGTIFQCFQMFYDKWQ